MVDIKKAKANVKELNDGYRNLFKKTTDTLKNLVADMGGDVEIKENYQDGTSPILIYIEDDNYVEAERIYISDAGNVVIETNVDQGFADDRSLSDLLFLLEWLVDQAEHPEYFVDPDEEDEEEEDEEYEDDED